MRCGAESRDTKRRLLHADLGVHNVRSSCTGIVGRGPFLVLGFENDEEEGQLVVGCLFNFDGMIGWLIL